MIALETPRERGKKIAASRGMEFRREVRVKVGERKVKEAPKSVLQIEGNASWNIQISSAISQLASASFRFELSRRNEKLEINCFTVTFKDRFDIFLYKHLTLFALSPAGALSWIFSKRFLMIGKYLL